MRTVLGQPYQRILLDATRWISAAHEATGRNGISAGYDLGQGWLPAYPETSGYLVPTLFRAAKELGEPELALRGHEVGAWLCRIQRSDGAFPGGIGTEGDPIVFDVGQIVLGLMSLWRETSDRSYLDAAVRAVDWLARVQQQDGSWLSHLDFANTYSARVTWAVAEVWQATGDAEHYAIVERSLRWILEQTRSDGWLDRMAFGPARAPYTHNIGYALRGLLRCGDLIGGELGARSVSSAAACAQGLAAMRSPVYPLLPGEISTSFESAADYACLTGDAQMVMVWLDLAQRYQDQALRNRCAEVIERLGELQVRQPLEPAAVGSLPGSWPLSGGFEPNSFPNWATKFLIDAALSLVRDEQEGGDPSSAEVVA